MSMQANLLNGLDLIRPQIFILGLTAITTVAVGVLMVEPFGVVGLAFGWSLALVLIPGLAMPAVASWKIRQWKAQEKSGSAAVAVA